VRLRLPDPDLRGQGVVVTRTGEALLAAVIAESADDLPRLAYADWLEEHGDDARAEFIRVQVRLGRGCNVCDGTGRNAVSPCPCALLRRRERELLLAGRLGQWSGFPEALWRVGL
jgi:uncharacterized protein (TIGR02996 family)